MPYKLSVGHLTVFLRQIFSVIFASCSVLIFSLPASITWVACFISFHPAMSPYHSMLLIFLMLFCDHIIIIQSLSNCLLMPIRFNHCCEICLHNISASKTCQMLWCWCRTGLLVLGSCSWMWEKLCEVMAIALLLARGITPLPPFHLRKPSVSRFHQW